MYRFSLLLFPIIIFLLLFSCSRSTTDSDNTDNIQPETSLEVIATYPAAGAEMSVMDSIVISFSRDLNCSTVNDNTIRIAMGKSGTLTCDSNTVIFKADLAFDFAVAVEVFVSKDITDTYGINLDNDFSYIFYTQVNPGK
ncbi:MAG: hypothetical protein DRP51_09805 [Candidatus Zixiibacteriota bacterium]|nr:MAG: hypothetical protein DRP51_09805 [candidate division Zixibacteria bacterium]HHI02584.1 hypothetical protein [candidate division Zixibacteria bacterium]